MCHYHTTDSLRRRHHMWIPQSLIAKHCKIAIQNESDDPTTTGRIRMFAVQWKIENDKGQANVTYNSVNRLWGS